MEISAICSTPSSAPPARRSEAMTPVGQPGESRRLIGTQERRLGKTVLRTYRRKADIDDIFPNERQPRLGDKIDGELQLQIEANEGLFEPLLVEPHPDRPDKFRI